MVLFSMYKNLNVLPEPGGLYDQDPELVEAFVIINNVISELESRKIKDMERTSRTPRGRVPRRHR